MAAVVVGWVAGRGRWRAADRGCAAAKADIDSGVSCGCVPVLSEDWDVQVWSDLQVSPPAREGRIHRACTFERVRSSIETGLTP